MPTYDYQCDQCGHKFERFQSITARPIRTCPACGKRSVRRLIGAGAGIIFKGSGFYSTDYRSESYRKAAEGDKPPASSGKTGAAKGSDAQGGAESPSAKPAGKADKPGKTPKAKPGK